MGPPEMGTLEPEIAHPFPTGFHQQAPSNSSESLWNTKHASGGLMKTSRYFAPEGKPGESKARPLPVWGIGMLSVIAERGQPLRDSSSKPNPSHGKTLLPGTVFWLRFLAGLFWHVQPRVSPDGPRQSQVCRKSHGTTGLLFLYSSCCRQMQVASSSQVGSSFCLRHGVQGNWIQHALFFSLPGVGSEVRIQCSKPEGH